MKEADLYPPLKAFLEAQGYEVKAEIGACDIMALRAGDPPLVVEMKLGFNLSLVLQGVARQALFDTVDPGPYSPRRNATRAGRLLREFQRRVGDPNQGGTTGIKRMTAYRQDALRCLACLADGPLKAAEVAKRAGVAKAAALMRADHYGWFDRVSLGVYALSPKGLAALGENADELARLGSADQTLKDSA